MLSMVEVIYVLLLLIATGASIRKLETLTHPYVISHLFSDL